jgi:NADPH:quinone reductase-like Zn-dependent oxidoreductase
VQRALPDLIRTGGGDPRRGLTAVDVAGARALGVRSSFDEDDASTGTAPARRYDVPGELAQLTAQGQFTAPIARTFGLADWRSALEISQRGHARGKLVRLPARTPPSGGGGAPT